MMRSIVPSAIVMVFTVLPLISAGQTSPLIGCDRPVVRLDDAWCASDRVFEGVPYKVDTTSIHTAADDADTSIQVVRFRFLVENALKGSNRGPVDVHTATGARDECAFRFIIGEKYLVFVREQGGVLVADQCMPTRAVATIGQGFTDSLAYVQQGNSWVGRAPVDKPCP